MSTPFTTVGAAAHAYRLYAGLPVVVGSHDIPMMASWIGGAVAALLGIMMLVESRR